MTDATTETNIWLALKTTVTPLADTFSLDMPLTDFDRPADGNGPLPYIEVRPVPNKSSRVLIGSGPHNRQGILQLSLMYPVALKHPYEVQNQKAGLIAAAFPADLKLYAGGISVRITKDADVRAPMRDDAYWRWPILVMWQCFA